MRSIPIHRDEIIVHVLALKKTTENLISKPNDTDSIIEYSCKSVDLLDKTIYFSRDIDTHVSIRVHLVKIYKACDGGNTDRSTFLEKILETIREYECMHLTINDW